MSSRTSNVRRAIKAGTWYSGTFDKLNQELTAWLQTAGSQQFCPARAIISPHAGYEYSGKTAAHAFKEIDPITTKRIFILGPSHRVRLDGIALSPAKVYQTPLGNLNIDLDIYKELHATKMFEEMSLHTDEQEHSIELQLPYIYKIMESCPHPYTIVPMMVGGISTDKEAAFGKCLAPYLKDPSNVFVISSDFCHWGDRFSYIYYDKSWGHIYQSIEMLDKLGMAAIKTLKLRTFKQYLREYDNTICGRHPIAVMLGAIEHLNSQDQQQDGVYNIKFIDYQQSSKSRNMNDSSVSYVAASIKKFGAGTKLERIPDIIDDIYYPT